MGAPPEPSGPEVTSWSGDRVAPSGGGNSHLGVGGGDNNGGSRHGLRAEGPPDEFIDPISQELMLDPVLLVETGQSYERSTIEAWFKRCTETGRPCTDPLTLRVLRHTTLVPNFSLKSLVCTWAERQSIRDLPAFSKELARQRTSARGAASPARDGHGSGAGAVEAAAADLAAMRLSNTPPGGGPGGGGAGRGLAGDDLEGSGSSSGISYPDIPGLGPSRTSKPAPLSQQQPSPPFGSTSAQAPSVTSTAQTGLQHQPQQDLVAGLRHPSLYPSATQPTTPVDKKGAAEAALTALRGATQQGGRQGAAAYHAWSLVQLAGDAEGRELLWEGNAIPLAIFLLGQPPAHQQQQQQHQLQQQGQQEGGDVVGLEAAKPALCSVLQRMGARDADMAASIERCGGVQVLVNQLTADHPELRAAASRALYFLGWQGAEIRRSMLDALSMLADACRLPARPLLAFWRFWEQRQQSSDAATDSLAADREGEWEVLALLTHMLAEGCVRDAARSAAGSAAQQAQQLAALDVTASAVPAVVAYGAATSESPAVRFAALAAARHLAALPSNLPQLIEAALQEGARPAAAAAAAAEAAARSDGGGGSGGGDEEGSSIAGQACGLLWELCYSPARGGGLPAAVQAVSQHPDVLLHTLEAALSPDQKPTGESGWLAAGLLACLMYEPPHHTGDSGVMAVVDSIRALLATHAAAGVLHRLVALMEVGAAAVNPQAATLAALAVGNMAAYRGAAKSPAVSPRVSFLSSGGGSGSLLGSGGGSGNYAASVAAAGPPVSTSDSSVGRLAAKAAAKLSAAMNKRGSPTGGPTEAGQASPPAADSQPPSPPVPTQPTEPRGALLHHAATQRLVRVVLSSSAAAAKADAAAAAPGGMLTPDGRQAAAAAASVAAETAAVQRQLLSAALQALNNLCVDQVAANHMRACARSSPEVQADLDAALKAAMSDRQLPSASRELALRLLNTESGVPGQRHSLACSCAAPPARPAAYPNP